MRVLVFLLVFLAAACRSAVPPDFSPTVATDPVTDDPDDPGEIEAVAVDDILGYVYYADEGDGIHKYPADPDDPEAARELAHFGRQGFGADREGIAMYARDDGTGGKART